MKTRTKAYPYICIAIVLLILFSVFAMPKLYKPQGMLEKLDRQMTTALELTATAAGAATALAAIPDDSTTPIADQIATVASYMTIACTALLLEKFIVMIAGDLAFALIIPIGLGFVLFSLLIRRRGFSYIGSRIIIAGLVLVLVIPTSLWFDGRVEQVLETDAIVEECSDLGGDFSLSWNIVGSAIDAAANALNKLITLAAVRLLTCCLVPIASVCILFSVLKWTFRGAGELLPGAFYKDETPAYPQLPAVKSE